MQAPSPEDITTIWSNASTSNSDIQIIVVIPTFKRPDHVITTLNSVLAQKTDRPFAIVVMDNHAEGGEGAAVSADLLKQHTVPATVILAHRRGNCAAYNAGFHIGMEHFPSAKWIQIIDDDEIARPDWLEKMADIAEKTNADCTGAPQHPIFPDGTSRHWINHAVFRPPYEGSGEVPILYSSGNVMIKTDLLRVHGYPWLDERFNFLGGGDSDFYSRTKADGATFAWQSDGGVDETTPARRTELSWLNSRSLRNGSISAAIQQKASRSMADGLKRIVKTCLLLAASPYRSLILFVKTKSLTMALNPMNVALGRLLMEFGFANEQYRAAEKN
jgi:glycosyltransferase involved in cell wall biosynthesis